MEQSRAVGDRRPPIVADDDSPIRAQRRNQPVDVSGQALDRVGLYGMRLVAAAVAAHVRRRDAIAGVRQRQYLMTP